MKRFAPILVVLISLGFYLPGLCRWALPGDVALYLARSDELFLNGFAQTHALFLLLGHVFLKLTPFLSVPTSLSLMSALFAAVTIGLVYGSIRLLSGGRVWPGLIGAGALMVAHTMWFHAVLPEVYSLNAMLMAGMVYAAVRWAFLGMTIVGDDDLGSDDLGSDDLGSDDYSYSVSHPTSHTPHEVHRHPPKSSPPPHRHSLNRHSLNRSLYLCLAFFLGGLGLANHMLLGLTSAVIGVWAVWVVWREKRSWWELVPACLAGVLGSVFLIGLVARDAHVLGWPLAMRMALVGGVTGEALVSYGSAILGKGWLGAGRQAVACLAMLGYNFAGVLAALILAGRRRGSDDCSLGVALPTSHIPQEVHRHSRNRHSRSRHLSGVLLLVGLFIVHFGFGVVYAIHEFWAFLLPAWLVLAILFGVWMARWDLQRRRGWIMIMLMTLLLPVVLYRLTPEILVRLGWARFEEKATRTRVLSVREYAVFYLWPPKSGAGTEARWMETVLEEMPPDAELMLAPGYRALALYYQKVEGRRVDVKLRGTTTKHTKDTKEGGE